MPKIFLCFSPITFSYFLQYIIHYSSSSSWPAYVLFLILKLFFCLMSFHPPLPSHPVFHRGLNHLPFPPTQLLIVSPDAHTSLPHSTNTALTVFPTSASFIQYLSVLLEDIFVRSIFSFLSNKRASLLTGDTPLSVGIPERALCWLQRGDDLDPVHFATDHP